MSIVEISSVEKSYGQFQALKNFSLNIEKGEFFGLLGPNGAGKTTLISILAGLSRATSGSIRIQGYDTVTDYQQARQCLGIVPQELVYDPFFNVRETLVFQSGYYGIRNNDDWIDEILENLGLLPQANVNTRSLSGGMKRRLLIAQALVHRPQVIVLDEPTAGVDIELRRTLWQFITRLNRIEGHTIILTTHYLEEAQALCTRAAMMQKGQLVALDKMQNLLDRFTSRQLKLHISHGELPEEFRSLVCLPSECATEYAGREKYPQSIEEALTTSQKQNVSSRIETLRIKEGTQIQEILTRCSENGCIVNDVETINADLEDVFLQLLGTHVQQN